MDSIEILQYTQTSTFVMRISIESEIQSEADKVFSVELTLAEFLNAIQILKLQKDENNSHRDLIIWRTIK